MVAISPQTVEKSAELVQQRKYDFDILRDEGNGVAEKLGLVFEVPADIKKIYQSFGIDLDASKGESSWTLPMPGRYVIDANGTIRYAEVHPDYTQRPEPADTVEALEGL